MQDRSQVTSIVSNPTTRLFALVVMAVGLLAMTAPIARGDTTVLVTQGVSDNVLKYQVDGDNWHYLGVFASGMDLPSSIAQQSGTGDVFIASSLDHEINRYAADGTPIGLLATLADRPDKMVLGADGNLYATIAFGSGGVDDTVQKIDTSTGAVTTFIAKTDSVNYTLNTPRGIAVDSVGNLYIASRGNGTIFKFDSAGNYVADIASVSNATGLSYDAVNDRLLVIGGTGNISAANQYEITNLATTPTLNALYTGGNIQNALDTRYIEGYAYWSTVALSNPNDVIAYADSLSSYVVATGGFADATSMFALIPTPAALPGGLMVMGLLTLKRRR